ncbi:MAG: hypothetical protein, partial [Olavius algarvensis Gamma 1 endosymbiont]
CRGDADADQDRCRRCRASGTIRPAHAFQALGTPRRPGPGHPCLRASHRRPEQTTHTN